MMKYCDGHERWVQMTMKHVWILSVLQCNYRFLPEAEPVAAAYKRLINREFLYLNSVSLKVTPPLAIYPQRSPIQNEDCLNGLRPTVVLLATPCLLPVCLEQGGCALLVVDCMSKGVGISQSREKFRTLDSHFISTSVPPKAK